VIVARLPDRFYTAARPGSPVRRPTVCKGLAVELLFLADSSRPPGTLGEGSPAPFFRDPLRLDCLQSAPCPSFERDPVTPRSLRRVGGRN
jgi:hypothetical protein